MEKRLRWERDRLGLTQPQFAEIAGAAKRTVIDWEKGVSSPTGVQLARLASAGVDVLYVLTGEHGKPIAPTFDGRLSALKEVSSILEKHGLEGPELTEILYILRVAASPRVLSPEQEKLLSSYENCSPDDRAAIQRLADAAAQPKAKPGGPKYRPKPGAGQEQPSIHDSLGQYATPKKPSEAA